MEVIALILVIVLISLSGSKKKSAGQAQARSQANAARIARAVSAGSKSVKDMSAAEREARREELLRRRAERRAAAAPVQPTVKTPEAAASAEFESELTSLRRLLEAQAVPGAEADEEGCVGGSMAHEHTEGESREEHARHVAEMNARDAREAAEASQRARPAIDAQDLRRAVVMSEVLGRPKALRRPGL